jgi:DNA-binding XRE family transcriptional regulator/DNA polymerase III delta prime subunit
MGGVFTPQQLMKNQGPNSLLRQARIEKGWTQRTLAHELGVEEQTVRTWERGTRFPSLEYRVRLGQIFEKTPAQLGLVDKTAQTAQEPSRKDKNRHRMLKRVQQTWIEGVLAHSLHQAALIALGLEEHPDALANPWQLAVQETSRQERRLPAGMSITQVYDDAGSELLILGEPGAGKTTLLLELARSMLTRAEANERHPIPVIFNLSSWASRQQPLDSWLEEELHSKYRVPPSVGRAWIEDEQLLVLLDGLDEVAVSARSACVKAINAYRGEYALTPIVVCCRRAEYFAQATRVTLQKAVLVQPLTKQQIDEYLCSAGEQLAGVRQALARDQELQEMIETPLMLSVVTLAYQGEANVSFATTTSAQVWRRQVFATYVQRMLDRRGAAASYSQEQTTGWLTWLARQLAGHSQTEFYVERLQPDWLPSSQLRQHYQHTMVLLIFGIQIFISAALFSWLRGGLKGNQFGLGVGLLGQLGAGSGNTILGWMARGLGGGLEGGGSLGIIIALVTVLVILLVSDPLPNLSVQALGYGVYVGLRKGLTIGGGVGIFASLVFVPIFGARSGLVRGFGAGIFSGLLIGLMAGLMAGLSYERERRNWFAQKNTRAPLRTRLLDVFVFSLCAALPFGAVYCLMAGGITWTVVTYSLVIGCFYGLAFGIGGGTDLLRGLGTTIQPAETVAWSWSAVAQNLPRNLWKGLLIGLVVSLPVGAIIACVSTLFYGVQYGVRYGLIFGLIIGLVGGIAAILTSILHSGWSSNVLEQRQLLRPNEGIRRSLRNAIFAGCLFGLIGGLAGGLVCGGAFGLVGELPGWPILSVGFAIILGIIFATQFALIHGGIATISHYILRVYLWRGRSMPGNYVRFLDYAAERILLSKVGGGYIFSHQLLLDFFARADAIDTV